MPVFRGLPYLKQKTIAGVHRSKRCWQNSRGSIALWCLWPLPDLVHDENNVPNVAGNVANPVKPELGANGAFSAAGQLRCTLLGLDMFCLFD